MPENKSDIARQLGEALKRTNFWDDITGLKYIRDHEEEWIYIDFKGKPAARRVNVTQNSGWEIIKSVVKALNHDRD